MQKIKIVFSCVVLILVNFCIAVVYRGCCFAPFPALYRRKVWQKPMGNLKMPIF